MPSQSNSHDRTAVVWPVGEPTKDRFYTSVRFSITPGVGSIASRGALGDMTAEATKCTPGMTTATAEVTHDDADATSGIIYFGLAPGKGDIGYQTIDDMRPTLDYALRMIAPAGGLSVEYLSRDPALNAPPLPPAPLDIGHPETRGGLGFLNK